MPATSSATSKAQITKPITQEKPISIVDNVEYKTVTVNGVRMFHREAGPRDAPVILLLHGFPSSSRMFSPLIPLLSDRFHLIAPDYPGFGHSDAPSPEKFSYTFDHLADCVGKLIDQLNITRYAIYLQDCGGPIGFRLAVAHPERVTALIIQNTGLTLKDYRKHGTSEKHFGKIALPMKKSNAKRFFLSRLRVSAMLPVFITRRESTPTRGPMSLHF